MQWKRMWRRRQEPEGFNPVNGKAPPRPPPGAKLISTGPHGILYIQGGVLHYKALNQDPVWGELTPVFLSGAVEEVWLTESVGVASLKGLGRARIHGIKQSLVEDLVVRLVAETGANVNLRRPRVVTEYNGWRLAIQIKAGGQLHVVSTKIQSVPPLRRLMDPLLAARILLLLMRPSLAVIAGPPGSGKTTLLNSLTVEAARLWPHLHIAVVEKWRELVLKGGWATRVTADLAEGIRYSFRMLRPDLLVVGEVSSKDAWSVVEPARSGVPTMTTYHSPNIWKTVSSLRDSLRLHLGPSVDEKTVLGYIDVIVATEKIVTLQGIERRVSAVYVSDGQRLLPLFLEGRHVPEEDFDKMMPQRLTVGEAERTKRYVYERLGVDKLRKYVVEPLEPVLVA